MERIRIDRLQNLMSNVVKHALFNTIEKTSTSLREKSSLYYRFSKNRYIRKEERQMYHVLHLAFYELSLSILETVSEEKYELFDKMVSELEKEFGRFEHEQI